MHSSYFSVQRICDSLKERDTHMDPAKGQKVMMILITEQLFHILHVTVVRASGLLGDDHMGQHKLIVRLWDNKTDFSSSINSIPQLHYASSHTSWTKWPVDSLWELSNRFPWRIFGILKVYKRGEMLETNQKWKMLGGTKMDYRWLVNKTLKFCVMLMNSVTIQFVAKVWGSPHPHLVFTLIVQHRSSLFYSE